MLDEQKIVVKGIPEIITNNDWLANMLPIKGWLHDIEVLSNMKEAYHIQVAEYDVDQGIVILHVSVFNCRV